MRCSGLNYGLLGYHFSVLLAADPSIIVYDFKVKLALLEQKLNLRIDSQAVFDCY